MSLKMSEVHILRSCGHFFLEVIRLFGVMARQNFSGRFRNAAPDEQIMDGFFEGIFHLTNPREER